LTIADACAILFINQFVKCSDGESTRFFIFTENISVILTDNLLGEMEIRQWKMAPERRTEPATGKAATGSACYSGRGY